MKEERGKVVLPPVLHEDIVEQGFRVIALRAEHVEACRSVMPAVADPFDRMMVAVARVEQLTLATRDGHLLSLGLKGVREL